jgi:hypothetical protein
VCVATTTITVTTAPADLPSGEIPWKESKRLILGWNAGRKRPRPICRGCHFPCARRDAGILRRRMCSCCEGRWLDRIVQRLIRRVGRKEAVRLIRALAPK